jgi:thioredoxin 1
MIQESSDGTFVTDVGESGVSIALLWANFSPPCKMLIPHFNKVVEETGIHALRLDVEENPAVPSQFAVKGLPTMMIFRDGQIKSMKVGAMPSDDLEQWIMENLRIID